MVDTSSRVSVEVKYPLHGHFIRATDKHNSYYLASNMIIIINNINGIKPKDKKDMNTKRIIKQAKKMSANAPMNDIA